MIDLEKGSEQLDKADGFLTKLGALLKKHWKLLLLIGFGWIVYWFAGEVGEEMDRQDEDATYQEEYYYPEDDSIYYEEEF